MKEIIIKIANKKSNKYGARKYAFVPSETDSSKVYEVAKLRKRDGKHYKYVCSCLHHLNTQKRCKHIKEFISIERKHGIKGVV